MRARQAWMAMLLSCAIAPASAQLLPIGSSLGGLPGGVLGPGGGSIGRGPIGSVGMVGDAVGSLSPPSLLSLRHDRLLSLVRDNRRDLDVDDAGNPIRRNEIIGINLPAASLAKAEAAGFRLDRREVIDGAALDLSVLSPPAGK